MHAVSVQIGLVDMLKEEYGIEPAGMLGHSAGAAWPPLTSRCTGSRQSLMLEPDLMRDCKTMFMACKQGGPLAGFADDAVPQMHGTECHLQVQLHFQHLIRAARGVSDATHGAQAGEIPCGYADGCLTREQTVLIAYHRGRMAPENGVTGASWRPSAWARRRPMRASRRRACRILSSAATTPPRMSPWPVRAHSIITPSCTTPLHAKLLPT